MNPWGFPSYLIDFAKYYEQITLETHCGTIVPFHGLCIDDVYTFKS